MLHYKGFGNDTRPYFITIKHFKFIFDPFNLNRQLFHYVIILSPREKNIVVVIVIESICVAVDSLVNATKLCQLGIFVIFAANAELVLLHDLESLVVQDYKIPDFVVVFVYFANNQGPLHSIIMAPHELLAINLQS